MFVYAMPDPVDDRHFFSSDFRTVLKSNKCVPTNRSCITLPASRTGILTAGAVGNERSLVTRRRISSLSVSLACWNLAEHKAKEPAVLKLKNDLAQQHALQKA